MNTPMKIAVAAVIIILMAVGFHVVDWSEKHKEIEALDAQFAERVQQKQRLEADVAKLPEYREEAAKLEKELLSLVQSKFTQEEPELFVANYIAEIERMVVGQQEATQDFDFQIKSITPRGQKMSKVEAGEGGEGEEEAAPSPAEESETLQGFPTRVFDMKMTARYKTLVDFLYELGRLELDRLVTINKITLSPGEGRDAGVSPILNVQIPITAYLRQGSSN